MISVNEKLQQILDTYKVDRDFSTEVRSGYRNPLEEVLNSCYAVKPHYRYGGSLAKGTANMNSSDIDLLCYFDSEYEMSLQNIFEMTKKALINNNFSLICKNSALTVVGIKGEKQWEISVDVVPGKYTSNDENKDVYLWCNKDKKRLKSNPEIQIKKVQQSTCKDIIRLIKLYCYFNEFKFKSFYLEIFAIDIVSREFEDNDNIYDKLIKFCKHYSDIGVVKIYDPANANNDINTIHDEQEFFIIREKIEKLYNVLLTNDQCEITNCIFGKSYNIEQAYLNNAISHSPKLQSTNSILVYESITLKGYYLHDNQWIPFNSSTILGKNVDLKFEISVFSKIKVKDVKIIISNAGYEAMKENALRGNAEETEACNKFESCIYIRNEHTLYFGNHFAQALVISDVGKKYRSSILVVKVR